MALLTEVEEMEGLQSCADQMGRVDAPPTRQLSADDVPAENSIPTTIYNTTASQIGLLGGIGNRNQLKGVVKFYSKVMRYKSIIRKIGDSEHDEDGISPVSDSDQEDLYNKIGALSRVRNKIIQSESFNVEYPEELE